MDPRRSCSLARVTLRQLRYTREDLDAKRRDPSDAGRFRARGDLNPPGTPQVYQSTKGHPIYDQNIHSYLEHFNKHPNKPFEKAEPGHSHKTPLPSTIPIPVRPSFSIYTRSSPYMVGAGGRRVGLQCWYTNR